MKVSTTFLQGKRTLDKRAELKSIRDDLWMFMVTCETDELSDPSPGEDFLGLHSAFVQTPRRIQKSRDMSEILDRLDKLIEGLG